MKNETDRARLIDEIEQLKFENGKIKDEIDKIEAKDERIRARTMIGDGLKKLYWKLPVKWLETVFYTKKEDLKEMASACMSEDCKQFLAPDFNFCRLDYATHVAQIAGVCEAVLETENGICIALRDPYQRFRTTPLEITADAAYKLVGKIIIIDGNIKGMDKTEITAYRYKATALTLKGSQDKTEEVTDPIAKLALELKDITTEDEAIKGVTAMQNYARAAMKNCKVLRISPTEARFLHKDEKDHVRLYGISFEKGEFWFMQDSQEHYFDAAVGKEFQSLFGENLINDDTAENIRKGRWEFACINEKLPEFKEDI